MFSLIREEPNRFPPEHTAYSKQIPNLSGWLFRWGNGVRIEQPHALRELHLQQAQGVVELYAGSTKA